MKIISQRLTNNVFENDLVARLSGDEFLLGLYLTNPRVATQEINAILQRILNAISYPININGATPYVSASIGAYYWSGNDQTPLEEALEKADKAMYQAKLSGKKIVTI